MPPGVHPPDLGASTRGRPTCPPAREAALAACAITHRVASITRLRSTGSSVDLRQPFGAAWRGLGLHDQLRKGCLAQSSQPAHATGHQVWLQKPDDPLPASPLRRRAALRWWRARGWLVTDPTAGWARPKIARDHSRPDKSRRPRWPAACPAGPTRAVGSWPARSGLGAEPQRSARPTPATAAHRLAPDCSTSDLPCRVVCPQRGAEHEGPRTSAVRVCARSRRSALDYRVTTNGAGRAKVGLYGNEDDDNSGQSPARR